MKRDVNFQLTVAVVLLTLTAAPGKETPGLSLSALPARAQQTIKAQLAGGQVEEIEETTADGNTFYEVQVIKAGTTRSLTVDAQGKLIRAQVALVETPPAVQKVINANLGKNKLGDIDRTSEQGETIYDVDLIGSDSESRGLSVAEDGKWFSLELSLADARRVAIDHTRQYAKRQLTWFRHQMTPDFVVDPLAAQPLGAGEQFLDKTGG